MPYLLSGELFPSDVRAFCKGLTRSVTCVLLVLGLKMYPILEDLLSVSGTFYLFAAILAFSLPIVYCILPETKDMGLEMIQNYFTPSRTVFYVDLETENEKKSGLLQSVKNVADDKNGQNFFANVAIRSSHDNGKKFEQNF